MATKFFFNGRKVKLPGAYSRIKSGRNNPPLDLDYGNVLIIDHNNLNGSLSANGMLGGSGVAGSKYQGKDSIYSFNNIEQFRDFVGHGWWYKAAEMLFKPNGSDPGVSTVYVIKPSTTTNSTLRFLATGGGSNGGDLKINTLDEGLQANGTLNSGNLVKGYAFKFITGRVDATKWIMQIWRGTYRGAYSDTYAYDEVAQAVAETRPELIIESPEFNNIQTLIDWAETDRNFGQYFWLAPSSSVAGTGAVDAADIAGHSGFVVSTGGTETWDSMDEALQACQDLPVNFVVTTYDDPDDPAADANIIKIKTWIERESEFDIQLWVYASDDTLADSTSVASDFDSDQIVVTHGGILKKSQVTASGLRQWESFFHMCYLLGRTCGLEPQVPLTFKKIDINGLVHNLTRFEQEQALDGGVLTTIFDTKVNDFVVLQDVNSLQTNDYILNADGTSHVIQFKRIAGQLNRELIINSRRDLLGNPLGVNRNTLSEQDLIEYVKAYLSRKVATPERDNLILDFQNVSVTRVEDSYNCTYEFYPNDEIRILFFTGFAL